MLRERPTLFLQVSAAISVVIAIVLCCGYFCTFGPRFLKLETVSIPTLPPSRTDVVRESCFVGVSRGVILIRKATSIHPRTGAPIHHGLEWTLNPGMPNIRQSLWGFQHGTVVEAYYIGPTMHVRYVTIPSWLILLPCLIAPVMWWRIRRRSHSIGFDVINKSA